MAAPVDVKASAGGSLDSNSVTASLMATSAFWSGRPGATAAVSSTRHTRECRVLRDVSEPLEAYSRTARKLRNERKCSAGGLNVFPERRKQHVGALLIARHGVLSYFELTGDLDLG